MGTFLATYPVEVNIVSKAIIPEAKSIAGDSMYYKLKRQPSLWRYQETIEKTKKKQKTKKQKNPSEIEQATASKLYEQFHSMSDKPLRYQQLTVVQKQVYNNAKRQGNKKGNCLVRRAGKSYLLK